MNPSLPDRLLAGRLGELVERAKTIEILDRSYQIAAQTFVAMIPLVLVSAAVVTGGQQVVANSLITRFGLVGFSAQVVADMLRSSSGKIYWLGLILSIYSAFSLSRRVSRAYNIIWRTPQLPLRALWRGLIWVGLQVALIAMVSGLRGIRIHQGNLLGLAAGAGMVVAWFGAEYASQWLLTCGMVARRRIGLAAGLVTVGRIGVSIWAMTYLAGSMSRQAELYGALGVVFSMFTFFLVTAAVLLTGTLIAAVFTEPSNSNGVQSGNLRTPS